MALVADEAALRRPADDGLDHAGVAAQEDVEVLRRERQTRLLLDRARRDDVLEVSAPTAPGDVVVRSCDDRDVVEVAAMSGQAGHFGPVAKVPGVSRAVDHDELPRPVADQLAAQHRHVGREAGAGPDHQHVLAGCDLVEREHPDCLGADIATIANLEAEDARGKLAAQDEGQVELDVLVGAAFRSDRIGAADHPIGIESGCGDRRGLGVDGGLALGRACDRRDRGRPGGSGQRRGRTCAGRHARHDARLRIPVRLIDARHGGLDAQNDVLAGLELERQLVRDDSQDDQAGGYFLPTRHCCVVFSRHAASDVPGREVILPPGGIEICIETVSART